MVKEKWCKTALSPSKLPGIMYSLNPYLGCYHGCKYCYVPNVLHVERKKWEDVHVKVNIPMVLRKELKTKKKGIVGISTATDPYQPLEKEYEITRKCLLLLLKHDFPIDIQTKSDLVLRDIDLIKKFRNAAVGITITTLDEKERKLLEPNAPSIQKRLDAIKKLSNEGIYSYIFFGPIFPTIEKEQLNLYVDVFKKAGAKEIMIDSLHLKKDTWESISSVLPEEKKKIFRERLFGNYYREVFNEMERICKDKITLTRAF
ncbi:MAG: radical SAM protein [Thermoplasmata archaeon]|nr:MAG: radical SAM protein [Thermoplasmata archaeon]